MAREIKFRCFFYDGADYSTGIIIDALEAINENYIEFCDDGALRPTDQCTILMQFTGLKDKNGKEIYEGDMVKHIDEMFKVFYNSSTASFDVEWAGGDCDNLYTTCFANDHGAQIEVIGNIYENPELLSNKTYSK